MIAMKWGIICSVPDPTIMPELEEFGEWMVDNLSRHARQYNLFNEFDSRAKFVVYCKPNHAESIYAVYERINREYSDVLYILHILPKKNSLEFNLFKDITINYAIIGQGVLMETALTKFSKYDLDTICKNMNQYLSRRLSQIISYRREENTFRLTINGKNPLNGKNSSKNVNFLDVDVSNAVELVLHSMDLNEENQEDDSISTNKTTTTNPLIMEKQIELKGFPKSFNKFQVASLFSDFRPLSVQICGDSTALVEFDNKFHTVQVVLGYDQRIIENFVITAKAKSPTIQLIAKNIAKRRLQEQQQIDQIIDTIGADIKRESL